MRLLAYCTYVPMDREWRSRQCCKISSDSRSNSRWMSLLNIVYTYINTNRNYKHECIVCVTVQRRPMSTSDSAWPLSLAAVYRVQGFSTFYALRDQWNGRALFLIKPYRWNIRLKRGCSYLSHRKAGRIKMTLELLGRAVLQKGFWKNRR